MSVLALALPVVHCQVVGLLSQEPALKILSLAELNGSTKWNVVVGLSGAPAAFNTPAPPGPATQSPAVTPAEPATTSPLMLKPPAGVVTGATPLGGDTA